MIKGGNFPSAKVDKKKLDENWDRIDWGKKVDIDKSFLRELVESSTAERGAEFELWEDGVNVTAKFKDGDK